MVVGQPPHDLTQAALQPGRHMLLDRADGYVEGAGNFLVRVAIDLLHDEHPPALRWQFGDRLAKQNQPLPAIQHLFRRCSLRGMLVGREVGYEVDQCAGALVEFPAYDVTRDAIEKTAGLANLLCLHRFQCPGDGLLTDVFDILAAAGEAMHESLEPDAMFPVGLQYSTPVIRCWLSCHA